VYTFEFIVTFLAVSQMVTTWERDILVRNSTFGTDFWVFFRTDIRGASGAWEIAPFPAVRLESNLRDIPSANTVSA